VLVAFSPAITLALQRPSLNQGKRHLAVQAGARLWMNARQSHPAARTSVRGRTHTALHLTTDRSPEGPLQSVRSSDVQATSCVSPSLAHVPGARYATVFFVAASTSSGVSSTTTLEWAAPAAVMVRLTAAAVTPSGSSAIA